MASGSRLQANVSAAGDGGNIVLSARGSTTIDGTIEALGKGAGHQGGSVETTGATLHIGDSSVVVTGSSETRNGHWLMHQSAARDFIMGSYGNLAPWTLYDALLYGDVTIKTGQSGALATESAGDIIFKPDLSLLLGKNDASGSTLTLSAYRDVTLAGNNALQLTAGTKLAIRTDNTGSGTGTVHFNDGTLISGDAGAVSIYYNPTSYLQPLDLLNARSSNGAAMFATSDIDARMYVNFAVTPTAKTYDGTTSQADYSVVARAPMPSGVNWEDSGHSGHFVSKHAGASKAFVVDSLHLTGDAQTLSNYVANGLDAGRAAIAKANVSISGVAAVDRAYDTSTVAQLQGSAHANTISGDAVQLIDTPAANFADKNIGNTKTVTVDGYLLIGADAGNYQLIQPEFAASISKATITLAGLAAANKTYDASTTATLSGQANLTPLGSDQLDIIGTATASFADKNVGEHKDVTLTGLRLGGADVANYSLVLPTLSADISAATLQLGGLSANNKVYDASNAASLSGTASVQALGNDEVRVGGTGVATFGDKNVGSNKTVSVSGYTIEGADAANYLLLPTQLSADISPASLQLSGLSVENKVYDATRLAQVSGDASIHAIGADDVQLSGSASASFSDKQEGSAKAVELSGFELRGRDAGNYRLVLQTGLTADITPAPLQVSGILATDKTWDGRTDAQIDTSAALLTGLIAGDQLSMTVSGRFADAATGENKPVWLSSHYSGADVANYQITDQLSTLANIAARPIPQRVSFLLSQLQQPQRTAVGASANAGQHALDPQAAPELGRIGNGTTAPQLQIQFGGVRLPALANNPE